MPFHKNIIGLLCLLFMFFQNPCAQNIDHTSAYRSLPRLSYFRLIFDNDYFTRTDYYYSQGISLEYVHPVFRKNPVNKIFPGFRNSFSTCGFSLNIFGFTPTNIFSDTILKNDRPYAAVNATRIFKTTTDTIHRKRLTASLSIGVIGPAALGNEFQTGIHKMLSNLTPKGWKNQVKNDFVVNYGLSYEKSILPNNRYAQLSLAADVHAGTLRNALSAGFHFMAGNFTDPYRNNSHNKITYYLYCTPKANYVIYDASLQGGMFNRNSPYCISTDNIQRVTFRADAGIVLNFRKLYLAYAQSFLTKEFRQGKYHRWGGISIGFSM